MTIARDGKGRFPKGASGNRRGRPRSTPQRIETLADINDMIIRVMNMRTTIRSSEGERSVSLLEANVLRLAMGGADNRLAAVHSITLTRQAIWGRQEQLIREEKMRQFEMQKELPDCLRDDAE
ncbi:MULTISPECIES: DUF5681 domain-containing protein [unclassified Sphingobium]|uniref:DUF5681 domain-containing protein n=1 Tax=unclassified Sphingobium TaxID=2611147 RepID=UPI000D175603|nr:MULTISPECIES: DUF5681 domain-containing protein [unclassified Sphingobium]MBG6119030.1 hypothetical protein [Sphingobium sp. JAI105]PSO10641.1 hypothetical protein C7E20_15545 [Sphingobium sp. AEW4]TWD02116.1 hypothetical protein FB595_1155 [Sphingobium sp. AEW010]TWD20635.1 hypothetical protein FB596_1155 [Sphingobium sp. AEW013]TWD23363.1 hypothetical protein FB594_1155 [Sphingobium sp. AEW001]